MVVRMGNGDRQSRGYVLLQLTTTAMKDFLTLACQICSLFNKTTIPAARPRGAVGLPTSLQGSSLNNLFPLWICFTVGFVFVVCVSTVFMVDIGISLGILVAMGKWTCWYSHYCCLCKVRLWASCGGRGRAGLSMDAEKKWKKKGKKEEKLHGAVLHEDDISHVMACQYLPCSSKQVRLTNRVNLATWFINHLQFVGIWQFIKHPCHKEKNNCQYMWVNTISVKSAILK